MNEQVHIIITGDRGKTFRLPCTRKKLKIIVVSSVTLFAVLSAASIYSISLFAKNQRYSNQLADLQQQLKTTVALIAEQQRQSDEKQLKLSKQVASLEQNNANQAKAFRTEKESILTNAISELKERSELIGQFIKTIGIKNARISSEDLKNSGGPFIQEAPSASSDLINRADKYISTLRYLPMGRPVSGPISSRFGSRTDPINGKTAFHTGLDFRAQRGEKVHATADGVVKKAYRNGGYGNFVEICHSNGYCSSYSHLQKYTVESGDKVKRGQIIGFVGNSGRSTGAHLHYEVTLKNKPVNPYQLMKVANNYKKNNSKTKKKKSR